MKPRNALLLTFQLLLQFGVFGIKSPSDPPPVIIRLDDITAGINLNSIAFIHHIDVENSFSDIICDMYRLV